MFGSLDPMAAHADILDTVSSVGDVVDLDGEMSALLGDVSMTGEAAGLRNAVFSSIPHPTPLPHLSVCQADAGPVSARRLLGHFWASAQVGRLSSRRP